MASQRPRCCLWSGAHVWPRGLHSAGPLGAGGDRLLIRSLGQLPVTKADCHVFPVKCGPDLGEEKTLFELNWTIMMKIASCFKGPADFLKHRKGELEGLCCSEAGGSEHPPF